MFTAKVLISATLGNISQRNQVLPHPNGSTLLTEVQHTKKTTQRNTYQVSDEPVDLTAYRQVDRQTDRQTDR